MDLAFEDKKIREICEKEAAAQALFGPVVAESLKNRLADLNAANWIGDLIAGRPTEMPNGAESTYRIHLKENHVLTFSCNHVDPPLAGNGSINWKKVRKIKITQIAISND